MSARLKMVLRLGLVRKPGAPKRSFLATPMLAVSRTTNKVVRAHTPMVTATPMLARSKRASNRVKGPIAMPMAINMLGPSVRMSNPGRAI